MSTNSCLTPQGVDLKWLEENLPHIPVNLLDDVVQIAHRHGVEAVGVFYNGIIELAKNSPRGTEYHEAFHAVFNSYLSKEQANKILKDTGKTEEQLANEFEDHYKFNIKPSSSVLTDFFNKIKFWIKEKLGLLKIHDLYSGLNSGYFKNKKPLNLVSNNAKFKESKLPIKTGISELFESNPELANIGTPEQYSQYLDTIFPDSKVKDIVFRGGREHFDKEKLSKSAFNVIYFSDDFSEAKDHYGRDYSTLTDYSKVEYNGYFYKNIIHEGKSYYVKKQKDLPKEPNLTAQDIIKKYSTTAEDYRKAIDSYKKNGVVDAVLINIKNLYNGVGEDLFFGGNSFFTSKGYDGFRTNNDSGQNSILAVFKPEQIHILGNKQDIEGFKKFVKQPINKEIKPNEVKEISKDYGEDNEKVDKIFKKYPELARVFNNNKELYNSYLRSIFPEASEEFKGKLFFHGTKNPIDGGKFKISDRNLAKGLWFTKQLWYAKRIEAYKEETDNPVTYGVILNIKNPKHFYNNSGALLVQRPSDFEKQYDRKNNDAAVFHHPESSDNRFTNDGGYNQVVVFDENQVHIIGDNADIIKAKEFLKTQITPQQKQEAQTKFQEYVDATGRQDIEGFKGFVKQPINKEIKPNEVKEISKDYGVVQVETNPSKEQTQQFIDLIAPQVKAQTYKENKGKFANEMFHYGLMWARHNPKAKPVKINAFDGGRYYSYHELDQNGNNLPSIKVLQPIINEIQKSLGLDMSDYDSVIGNIYVGNQYVYPHKDTTESKSARNYPVIVYTIGNNAGLGIVDNNQGKMTFANQYDKQWLPENEKLKGYTNELVTHNGSIYTFGLNGKGRFELTHSTPINSQKKDKYPPLTLPNGQTITNYTITLTFRRATDLDVNTPITPKKITNKSTEIKPKIDSSNFTENSSTPLVTQPKDLSKVTDISEEDKIELVNSGTYITMYDLMEEQGTNNPYYLDLSKFNQEDLIKKVRESFKKLYNTKEDLPQESHYLIDKIIEPKNLKFLVKRTLKELENKTTMKFDIEDDLFLEENISEEIYEKSKFKVNPTEKFGTEFNMFLGSLTKRVIVDGKLINDRNKLGLPQYLTRAEVLNDLFDDISNINDINKMIEVLESKKDDKPHYYELLEYVNERRYLMKINKEIFRYDSFKNTFFSNLNLYYKQFVTATTEIKEEYIPALKEKVTKVTARTSNTNTQGVNNPLLQEFKATVNTNVTKENVKALAKQFNLTDKNGYYIKEYVFKTKEETVYLNNTQKDQLIQEIDKLFNIKLSKKTVDFFIDTTNIRKTNNAPSYRLIEYKNIPVLFEALEELITANKNEIGTSKNLRKLVNKEAEERKIYNKTLTAKDGTKFYAIKQYTATEKLLTNIKNKGYDYLQKLKLDRFFYGNPIIKGDSLVSSFESNNIVINGDNTSKAYQEMNSLEWEKTCLEMYHNNTTYENGNYHGTLPLITPSDASNIEVRGIVKRDNLVKNINGNINVNTLNNVLYNSYILPELKRIKKVKDINFYINYLNTQLKASKNDDEKRNLIKEIKSLTVKEWNKQGESFVMFPELNPLIDTLLVKYGSYLEGKNEIFDNQSPISGQIIAEISPILNKVSLTNLQTDFNYLQEIGLINKEGLLNNKLVSDSARNYLRDKTSIFNYLANRWLSNLECTIVQSGDLAFYKSFEDANKRAKQAQVPARSVQSEMYKVVFTESINKESQYYEAFKDIIGESLADGYKLKVEKNKGIDTTDAATFATMKRITQICNAKGKDGRLVMEAIKRITENTGLDYSKDLDFVIQSLKTFTFGHMPVNMNYKVQDEQGNFTIDKSNTTLVPTQIKHAVIPLIPAFIEKHPQLKLLNEKMLKEDIGEWIFDSGTKVGTRNLVSKEEVSEWLKDETGTITLSTVELDMEHWGEVLDVPYKNETSEKLSSQKMRKAMENINPTDMYNVNWSKTPITGQELIDHYNKAIDSVLRSQFETLEDKMFTDGVLDVEKFKTHLKGLIEANDPNSFTQYWDDVLENLTENNLHVLDTPFNKNKIYSLLASNFNKEVLDIEITGKSAVLASTYGLQGDGIDIIDLAKNLDGTLHSAQSYNQYTDINVVKANLIHIQREFNRLGMNVPQDEIQALEALKTTSIVTADEIIVTPAYFIKSLKKKGIDPTIFMDKNGNFNADLLPEELRFVSFHRIPYQDKNSNSKAYIKSFTNVSSGTVIYFSPDILVRSGGDFDIDKVYIEFYDYSIKYGSLLEELKNQGVGLSKEYTNEVISEMIQLEDEELTIQELEIKKRLENFKKPFLGVKRKNNSKNQIIDSHLAVASSPHHYKELVTPNNAEGIRTIRNDLTKGKQKENTPWYSVKKQGSYRAANKACKDLIGIYSVMNVFHGIAQQIKPKFKEGYGVFIAGQEFAKFGEKEDLEGNLISDNNQQYGTAAVDGVKDPMLGDLNHSVFTAPLKGMLNLLGIGKTRLEQYTNNPMYIAVGKYYDEYSLTETSSKATRMAFEQVAKDNNFNEFAWSYLNDFYTIKQDKIVTDKKGQNKTIKVNKKSDVLFKDFIKQTSSELKSQVRTDVSSNMLYSLMYHHQLASKTSDFIQGSRLSNSGIKNNVAENTLNLNKNEEYFLKSEFIEFNQNVLDTHWLGTYNKLMQGNFRNMLSKVNTYHTPFYELTFKKAKEYGISLNNRTQVDTFYRALDMLISLNDNYSLRETYKGTKIKKGEFLEKFPKAFHTLYVKNNVGKNHFLNNLQLGKDSNGMVDLRFKWNDDLYFDQVSAGATEFYNEHPEAAKRLFGYSLKKYGFGATKLNPLNYMEAVYFDLGVDEKYQKDYTTIKNAKTELEFPDWFDMDSFLVQYAMNNPSNVRKIFEVADDSDFNEGLNNYNNTIYLVKDGVVEVTQESFPKSQGNNNYVANVSIFDINLEKEEGCYWG